MFRYVLLIILFGLTSNICAQDNEWSWRRGKDPDSTKRTKVELDSLLQLHSLWLDSKSGGQQLHLDYAYFDESPKVDIDAFPIDLRNQVMSDGGTMTKIIFSGANMSKVSLKGADLSGVDFLDCNLSSANLRGANLTRTSFLRCNLSDVHFAGATIDTTNFAKSNFSGASFDSTSFGFCILYGADFSGVIYNPTIPPKIEELVYALNLDEMSYHFNKSKLVALQKDLEEGGYRQASRDIICALRRNETEGHNFGIRHLEYVFFDLTSEYGSNLSRLWIIVWSLWLFCSIIYWFFMLFGKRSGVQLILRVSAFAPNREPKELNYLETLGPDQAISTMLQKNERFQFKDSSERSFRRPMWLRLIWWSLFFSATCAFNIGFRDINFGRWLRLLTQREFDLKPVGQVRVIAGFQALISVYLIALWVLSFAGTPFK